MTQHWVRRIMSRWTDEQTEKLRELRHKGLSATEIGLLLQVTRNAVIGRLFRLGIPFMGTRTSAPRPPKEPPKIRKYKARQKSSPQLPEPPPPIVIQAADSYWDGIAGHVDTLAATECHWPLPDGYAPTTGFCRAPIAEGIGQPYCPYHRHVSSNGTPGRIFVQIEGKPRGWKF